MTLKDIETNKTNKKQRKVNLTHIDEILNVNIVLLTLISSSAFNVAIYVAVFTSFQWNYSNVSSLFLHVMRMVKCQVSV